jgi:hypothetical protein
MSVISDLVDNAAGENGSFYSEVQASAQSVVRESNNGDDAQYGTILEQTQNMQTNTNLMTATLETANKVQETNTSAARQVGK